MEAIESFQDFTTVVKRKSGSAKRNSALSTEPRFQGQSLSTPTSGEQGKGKPFAKQSNGSPNVSTTLEPLTPSSAPTASANSTPLSAAATPSSTKPKKKKKESKEARLRRREEEKYKSIYGPKDSHIQLTSPALFAKLRGDIPFSSSTPLPSKVVRPILISATSPVVNLEASPFRFSKTPWGNRSMKMVDLDSEFPALGDLGNTSSSASNRPSTSTKENLKSVTHEDHCLSESSLDCFHEERSSVNIATGKPEDAQTLNITETPEISAVSTTFSFRDTLKKERMPAVPQIDATISVSPAEPKLSKKKPSKNPMIISIESLLAAKKETVSVKRLSQAASKKLLAINEKVQQPAGNLLDSSGIKVMHRGKMREKPKKKKPSKLKKAILLSRELRKKLTLSDSQEQELSSNPSMELENSASLSSSSVGLRGEHVTVDRLIKIKTETSDIPYIPKEEVQDLNVSEADESAISKKKHNRAQRRKKEKVAVKEEVKLEVKIEIAVEEEEESMIEYDESVVVKVESLPDDYFHRLVEDSSKCPETPVECSTSLEPQVISPEIFEQAKIQMHSRKFRQYCDMYTSKTLHGSVISLLKELHRFQDKLYKTDMLKYKLKKRYVLGIKEISGLISVNKIQLILVAPDIESNMNVTGGLDDILGILLSVAKSKNIPVIFTGNRFILGKPIFIKSPVSAIGIIDHQGTEELYRKVLEEASELRLKYQTDFDAKVRQLMFDGTNEITSGQ